MTTAAAVKSVTVGNTARFNLLFQYRDANTGALTAADPTTTTVTYTVDGSGGSDVSGSVVPRDGDGEFYLDVLIDTAGQWRIEVVGTGIGPQAAQNTSHIYINAEVG